MFRLPDIGAAPPFSGTVAISEDGLLLGSASQLDFVGMGSQISISGSNARVPLFSDGGWGIILGNGSAVIGTGSHGSAPVPYGMALQSVEMFADQTGTLNILLRKATYGGLPPTATFGQVELVRQRKSQDTGLSKFSGTAIAKGDWIDYFVTTGSAITRAGIGFFGPKTP